MNNSIRRFSLLALAAQALLALAAHAADPENFVKWRDGLASSAQPDAKWLAGVKDRGYVDADGYFFHAGRSDDVIISGGWTMSALEIEQPLLAHPDVLEAAVIGVPDELRGQIPKACIVAPGKGPGFVRELQEFVKDRLSKHEYPRAIEIVAELPKTPAGKIDRKTLRDRGR